MTTLSRARLSSLTLLTAAGLVVGAIAIWIQALSGDPAYHGVPPGPIIFVIIAGFTVITGRWWWAPLPGALISLLTTTGWWARLPQEMLRLTHPGTVAPFAAGIFFGTLLQIIALLVIDVAGIVATVQNFRRMRRGHDPV
jgi:hypothetical protein